MISDSFNPSEHLFTEVRDWLLATKDRRLIPSDDGLTSGMIENWSGCFSDFCRYMADAVKAGYKEADWRLYFQAKAKQSCE